ncbi:helix-turn-helix domain-containing protein [Calothrix sp. UHCC 0171]|uniref:helix-turn-helix domain-containing protein n=1 Tax=Calothrix sp. UHCC 0171 TaxID=3110245 RepID=UPI002B203AD6|nr:helix-turn-helix domain-containing protein [Calothrix sp. UHCC 0171]MEA5574028.1 helix-turn-helix domain-containing protein [Calothrix sp. UHCC 0171]
MVPNKFEQPEVNTHNISTGKYLTAFQRKFLKQKQQENLSSSYHQRIEIMLLADEGKTQTEICQILGCCPATVRHWMHIARTGMAHQWQDCPLGRPKAINQEYIERLQELLSQSPRDYGYGFRRWTISWLRKHLAKELGIEVSDRHLKRVLKQMGLSTIPKPNPSESENTEKTSGGAKISISDLKVENSPDHSKFFLLEAEK